MPTPAAGLLMSARRRSGMSQAQVAAAAGVTRSVVSSYETDRRQPTLPMLLRLLKASGFELRLHLAPYDDHDAVLAAQLAGLPEAQRARWEDHQRQRLEDNPLARKRRPKVPVGH